MKEFKKFLSDSKLKKKLEENRINIYEEGYYIGTLDALIRLCGLYFTYRVRKFMLISFVFFPKPKPKDK